MEQNDNDEEILNALNIRDTPDAAIIVEEPIQEHSDKKKTRKHTKVVNNFVSVENSATTIHNSTSIDASTETVDSASTQHSRTGKVESIKAEYINGSDRIDVVVISGAFKIEENIRLFLGCKVINDAGEVGEITGPFGKLGKFKATFTNGCTSKVDSNVDIYLPTER
jgi:hypothetical protein